VRRLRSERSVSEAQSGKALEIRLLEAQGPMRKKSSDDTPASISLGICERWAIGVRMSGARAGDHDPSAYSTIECTTLCGWTHDLDLLRTRSEQPARLDDLQSCSSWSPNHRDLASHDPFGCAQASSGRHAVQLRTRTRPEGRPIP